MSAISKFQSLPLEIISLIIDNVYGCDRHSMSLTCRGLYNFILPSDDLHLAGPRVKLNHTISQRECIALYKSLKIIHGTPDFSKRLISVTLNLEMSRNMHKSDVVGLLGRLPNLQKLKICKGVLPVSLGGFKKLELLYASEPNVSFVSGNLRSCFPALEQLCFDFGTVSMRGDSATELVAATEAKHKIDKDVIASLGLFRSSIQSQTKEQYQQRLDSLFDRYEEGMALFWEDNGRMYKRFTPVFPHCKGGDSVYEVSPFRDKKRQTLQPQAQSLGSLTQADVEVLRGILRPHSRNVYGGTRQLQSSTSVAVPRQQVQPAPITQTILTAPPPVQRPVRNLRPRNKSVTYTYADEDDVIESDGEDSEYTG